MQALHPALLGGSARKPSFAWDFAARQALPPGATFTRASAGRYFDAAGVLQSAGNNVARFDHDPLTGAPLGYLAEMQSTNSVINSSDFSGYFTSGVAQTTDGTFGPDGTTQMRKITASAGAGSHYIRTPSASATAASVYSISFIVKQGNQRYCTLGDDGDAVFHLVTFDFNTGTFSNQTNATAVAQQLASGLWRLSLQATATNTHTPRASIGFGSVANVGTDLQNFTAAGTETGYATATQVELGGVGVTSYIPTAGATATRAQDVLSLPFTSLPGWNPSQGGVLVAAYRLNTRVASGNQTALYLNDGSVNNSVHLIANASGSGGTGYTYVVSGGADQANVNSGITAVVSTRAKQAASWGRSRDAVAINGTTLVGASGSLLLPVAPTTLDIGRYSAQGLNGTLESIAYYRGARSDAFVQQVSR